MKWETAREIVPEPEIEYSKFNKAAILSLGSCDGAVKEMRIRLKSLNLARFKITCRYTVTVSHYPNGPILEVA